MLFSEPGFLFLFLPSLLALYYLFPQSWRNALLLIASLLFYAAGETIYVCVMLASILFNYMIGLWIAAVRNTPRRRLPLVVGVAGNLAALGAYKYASFIADNLNVALGALGVPAIELAPVHLPIGISFFTFQAISYVVDVHRQDAEVQTRPVGLALYIALFPQLIAGPIVRYGDVVQQLLRRTTGSALFASGIRRFVIGLGKKMIVANTVGAAADEIFALRGSELSTGLAWLGIACYALQIYFDFSGYSDMAIGLGRLFGFRFLENFDLPYTSQSIAEFWRRWHMSLSRWFRDYLYIPLGGNRCPPARVHLNLITVFCLCGLWHGASWSFMVWGLYHGAFLIVERAGLGAFLEARDRFVRHVYVIAVVLVGWVFFRADTLTQALSFLRAMAGQGDGAGLLDGVLAFLDLDLVAALSIGVIGSTSIPVSLARRCEAAIDKLPGWRLRTAGLCWRAGEVALLTGILVYASLLMAADTHNPFIYFRF